MKKVNRSNSTNSIPPDNRFSNTNNSNIDKQAERFRNKFPNVLDKIPFRKNEQNEQEEETRGSGYTGEAYFGQQEQQQEEREQQEYPEESINQSTRRQREEHHDLNIGIDDNDFDSNRKIPKQQQQYEADKSYSEKYHDIYSVKEKSEDYYTGEKNKKLFVHVIENGVEVTKPIRKRIYDQQVIWKKRVFPIDIKQTIVDAKGIHHLYVSANDMAILSFRKDHADHCRKCNGKMFIDARNARDLLKRNTIQAIWGIDSTHMILLLVFAVGMMASIGFAFYSFNQDTLHNTQLTAEKAKTAQLTIDNSGLRNQTQILQNIINNPDGNNNPNEPIPPTLPTRPTTPRNNEPITPLNPNGSNR